MTPEQKAEIDAMTQVEMASLWRFAPSGHPYFVSGTELSNYFAKVFKDKGSFTPEVSKQIGWGDMA